MGRQDRGQKRVLLAAHIKPQALCAGASVVCRDMMRRSLTSRLPHIPPPTPANAFARQNAHERLALDPKSFRGCA